MAKNIIRISEAEAASDFAGVLARVRAGAEIIIGDDARPVAVVRPAEPHVRWLSESLRLAKEHASTATLDEDFARDLEEVINSHREPLNPPRMGLILDSSVVIAAERRGDTVEQLIEKIVNRTGDQEAALCDWLDRTHPRLFFRDAARFRSGNGPKFSRSRRLSPSSSSETRK
jgi:prevent-host-death family protein